MVSLVIMLTRALLVLCTRLLVIDLIQLSCRGKLLLSADDVIFCAFCFAPCSYSMIAKHFLHFLHIDHVPRYDADSTLIRTVK